MNSINSGLLGTQSALWLVPEEVGVSKLVDDTLVEMGLAGLISKLKLGCTSVEELSILASLKCIDFGLVWGRRNGKAVKSAFDQGIGCRAVVDLRKGW